MELSDVFPKNGQVQRIYCKCQEHLELTFIDFNEVVSGVDMTVRQLPTLNCPKCESTFLPDRSRIAIIDLHRQAVERKSSRVEVDRKKTGRAFKYTNIPFLYDSDDYYYIPGLFRQFDEGFLTPVFFNKEVLLKYDAHPSYRVTFASTTYGSILEGHDFSVSFGINRHGRVVMWLGDIAQLPESEQYYLRSENVPSDHSIGSEFYDGQIECVFTEQTQEDILFEQRSRLLEAGFARYGTKLAHLEREVLELAASIRRPVVDTAAERRNIVDALNKVYLESFDNQSLGKILSSLGSDPSKLGSLKRVQRLGEAAAPTKDIASIMSPLYVLYDFRVAYSHLGSDESRAEKLRYACQRLQIAENSDLFSIYDALLPALRQSLAALTEALAPLP